jgi:cell division septation protein DedD
VELTAESLPHAKVPNTEIEIAVNAAALNPPSKVTIQTQEEPPLTHTKPVAAEPIQSQPSQIMPLEKTKKTNKANKKNKAKKTGIEHGVAIQLGAFGYPEHAQDLIHKLKKQNYPAYSRKSHDSKRILTLVYVGPFLVRDEALSMMANIEAHFALKGIMVKYHAVENEE